MLYRQVTPESDTVNPSRPRGALESDDVSMTDARPVLPLWRRISQTLLSEIGAEGLQPGAKLPTEAQLAARFGVNRHTVTNRLRLVEEKIGRSLTSSAPEIEAALRLLDLESSSG